MKRYRILLFDADNTLFDFDLAEQAAFREAMALADLPYSDEVYRLYSAINDSLWKALERREITLDFLKLERFRRTLSEIGERDRLEERAAFLRDTYISRLAEQGMLVEGAAELCRSLAGEYEMYIITNGISAIQRKRFSKSELAPYFKGIFVSEELGVQKPGKAYFDEVFRALGNPDRAEVLVIGDSLTSDCDGAIAYGLDICRYNPKAASNEGRAITYTVRKLSEIEDILNGVRR